jgi:hypothetical protein
VTYDLVATAVEVAGGQKFWYTLRGLTVDLSVGVPASPLLDGLTTP